jgi:hypothetical protein
MRLDGRRDDPLLPRALLQVRAWSHLSIGSSRTPQLVRPGLWAEQMPAGGRNLRFGDEAHAVTLFPTGFDGGSYGFQEAGVAGDAMADDDDATPPTAPADTPAVRLALKGRVPLPHASAVAVEMSPALSAALAWMGASVEEMRGAIATLPTAPTLDAASDGVVSLRWRERRGGTSAAAAPEAVAAGAALRTALPDDCSVVAVGDASAGAAIGKAPDACAALALLAHRLRAGAAVHVAPPPRSLEELLGDTLTRGGASADGLPPRTRVSGVPAPRLQSGRHRRTARRAKTPVAARRLRLASPPWPIDWSATADDAVPAWLWTRAHGATRSREAGHGLPRMATEDLGAVQYHQPRGHRRGQRGGGGGGGGERGGACGACGGGELGGGTEGAARADRAADEGGGAPLQRRVEGAVEPARKGRRAA